MPTTCCHIYGHQDRKNKPKPPAKLSEQAKMNIGCNMRATATVQSVLAQHGHVTAPQILHLPYPGSKAMLLHIGWTWITSKTPKHLHWAHRIPFMKQYCFKQHKWAWREKNFEDVYWDSIESVRRRLKLSGQVRTSKIMHGWLPLMHNRGHMDHSHLSMPRLQ